MTLFDGDDLAGPAPRIPRPVAPPPLDLALARRDVGPFHRRKGEPMPCPLCVVGTCIPCTAGDHDRCTNTTGEAILACSCCPIP